MDIVRKRLPSGLRVVVAPIAGLRSVAVLLAIEAGQWFEPRGRPGIARLTAQAMLRGTTKHDSRSWADALDGIGAAARLDVGSHAATFSAQSLGADLPTLLAIMSEAVIGPAFVVDEVELVRQQTLGQIEVVPDQTQSDIIIGWPGLPRNDPRFVAARVTNMVFAADTFASRAGHVVRDELGLAYYVFSTIGSSRGQSPWTVRMGVNPTNVERAISVALDELRKILD